MDEKRLRLARALDAVGGDSRLVEGDPEANANAAGVVAIPAKALAAAMQWGAENGPRRAYQDASYAGFGEALSPQKNVVGGPNGFDSLAIGPLAAIKGIRAFHGSPHDFDKFSMAKIGTGEGAQAYGHGLYFADKEAVAKSYRDMAEATIGGRPFNVNDPVHKAVSMVDEYGTKGAALDAVRAKLLRDPDPFYQRVAQVLQADSALPKMSPGGKMYEVNIRANPDQFLDWDKPLSAQSNIIGALPEKYRTAAADMSASSKFMGQHVSFVPPTGEDIYKAIARSQPGISRSEMAAGASTVLRDSGIPGIKYLDQGSRPNPAAIKKLEDEIAFFEQNAPKDKTNPWYVKTLADYKAQLAQARGENSTRNYVVNRDDIIDILRKYGIPVAAVAGAGALAAPNSAKAAP